jgi:hypothetical protein
MASASWELRRARAFSASNREADGDAMIERRREIRCTAAALQVAQATLRPGQHVQVIDLSPMGALVETDRPLRPGSLVHVRIVTEACTVSLPALIVHCSVWAIHAEEGVTYRGGLRFDERCARLAAPTR